MVVESVYVFIYLRGLSQLIKDDNIPLSFHNLRNLFEMQNNKNEYDTVVCGGKNKKGTAKNRQILARVDMSK